MRLVRWAGSGNVIWMIMLIIFMSAGTAAAQEKKQRSELTSETSAMIINVSQQIAPRGKRQRSTTPHLPVSGDEGEVRTQIIGNCRFENVGITICSGNAENDSDQKVQLYAKDGDGCDNEIPKHCFDIRVNGSDIEFTNGRNNINVPPGGDVGFRLRIKGLGETATSLSHITLTFIWESESGRGTNPFHNSYKDIPIDPN